jgi:glycosyltransferase involved in cell wall biosynthesis
MRIGFDAKRAFNNGTGLGNYSRFVINGLLKYFPEHEYFLFTPKIKPEFDHFFKDGSNVKIVTPESLLGKTFSSLWRTYSIAEMCNELKLDVFHGLSNELPMGIEKFKGKKIVTIHDLIFLRYPDYYNNIDRYIYTKKFKYACKETDVMIAASHQTKQDIIYYFKTEGNRIVVGYQNCDERFGLLVTAEQKQLVKQKHLLPGNFMLCVGTIEKRKNQLTVLKAFHQLNQPDLSLVFIGRETSYANELRDYIKINGLESKVLFLKNIEQDELPVIYQLAKVFVYASEFEGFGIPVLEGLRSGIPVIAANASSLPEVGGNVALYFDSHSIEELTLKLSAVLNSGTDINPQDRTQQLLKFDPGILTKQLMETYRL